MSLPGDGTLTATSLPADFMWPMRSAVDPLTDYEMGGLHLQQPNDSLSAQLWTLTYDAPDVVLTGENGARTVLFSRAGITELALAFDQNMNAFVAFVEAGQARFWWFDTNAGQMTFSDLPTDAVNPRCCLDERRKVYLDVSDIILVYVRAGSLCYRQQRDRFQTEYVLQTGVTGTLLSVGLNRLLRLQFKIRPADY